MPASFDYSVVRVVPRVERQEFINAGVIAFCREQRYLAAEVRLNETRLRALWPGIDVALVRDHVMGIVGICEGRAEAGAIARLSQSERFHWLTAARSTMIQMSPVHTGVAETMEGVLERLVRQFLWGLLHVELAGSHSSQGRFGCFGSGLEAFLGASSYALQVQGKSCGDEN